MEFWKLGTKGSVQKYRLARRALLYVALFVGSVLQAAHAAHRMPRWGPVMG